MVNSIIRHSAHLLLIMFFCVVSDARAASAGLRQAAGKMRGVVRPAPVSRATTLEPIRQQEKSMRKIFESPLSETVVTAPPIAQQLTTSPIQTGKRGQKPESQPKRLSALTKKSIQYYPQLESLRERNHACFDLVEALFLQKSPEWIKKVFEKNKETMQQSGYSIGFIDPQATNSHAIITSIVEESSKFLEWYSIININANPLFEFIRLPDNSIMYLAKTFDTFNSILIKTSTWFSGQSFLDPLTNIETIQQLSDADGAAQLNSQLTTVKEFKTKVEQLQQKLPEYQKLLEEGKKILDLSPEQIEKYEQNLHMIELGVFNTIAETESFTQLFTELQQKITHENVLRAEVEREFEAVEKNAADVEKLEREIPQLTEDIAAEQREIDALQKELAKIAEESKNAKDHYAQESQQTEKQLAQQLEKEENEARKANAFRDLDLREQEKFLEQLKNSYEEKTAKELAKKKEVRDQKLQEIRNTEKQIREELELRQKESEQEQKDRSVKRKELEQRAKQAQVKLEIAQKEETEAIEAKEAQEKVQQKKQAQRNELRSEIEQLEQELKRTEDTWHLLVKNESNLAQQKEATKKRFAEEKELIEANANQELEDAKNEKAKKIVTAKKEFSKIQAFLNADQAEQKNLIEQAEKNASQEAEQKIKVIQTKKTKKLTEIQRSQDKKLVELQAQQKMAEQKGIELKAQRETQKTALQQKYKEDIGAIENEENLLTEKFQNERNEIEQRKQKAAEKRTFDEKDAQQEIQNLEEELKQREAQHAESIQSLEAQKNKVLKAQEDLQKANQESLKAEKAHRAQQKKEQAQQKIKKTQDRTLKIEEHAAEARAKLELLQKKEQELKSDTEGAQKDVLAIQRKLKELEKKLIEPTQQKEELEAQLRKEEKLEKELAEKEEKLLETVQEKRKTEKELKAEEEIVSKAEEQRKALAEKVQYIGAKKEIQAPIEEVLPKKPTEPSPVKPIAAEEPEAHVEAEQRREDQTAAEQQKAERAHLADQATKEAVKGKEGAEAQERQRLAKRIEKKAPQEQEKIEEGGGDGSLPTQIEKKEELQPEISSISPQQIPQIPKPPVLPEFPQKEPILAEKISQPEEKALAAEPKQTSKEKPERTTTHQYVQIKVPQKTGKPSLGQYTPPTGEPFQLMKLPETLLTDKKPKSYFQPHIPRGTWTKSNQPSPRTGVPSSGYSYEQSYFEQPLMPQPEIKSELEKIQERPITQQPVPHVIHEKLKTQTATPLAQRKGSSSASWLTYLKGVMQLAKAKETQKMVETAQMPETIPQKKINPVLSFIQNTATAIKNTFAEFFDTIKRYIQ